MAVLNSVERAK